MANLYNGMQKEKRFTIIVNFFFIAYAIWLSKIAFTVLISFSYMVFFRHPKYRVFSTMVLPSHTSFNLPELISSLHKNRAVRKSPGHRSNNER